MDVPNIQKRSEKDPEKIPTKNKHPKNIQKTSKKHSKKIQKHPKNILKTSKKHPKNIPKSSEKELWDVFWDVVSFFAFYFLMTTYLCIYIIIIFFAILRGSEIFLHGEIGHNNYIC